MKTGLKLVLGIGCGLALLQVSMAAQDKPAATGTNTNAPKLSPQEQKEKWSYAIGMNIGTSMKRGAVDLDVDTMAAAIKDVLAGRNLKMTDQEAQEAWRSYQMESRTKQEEVRKQQGEKNKKEGEAFLGENKKKPGVKTHTVTLPDGTKAEMQYKVITEGTGAIPRTNDTVSVNYRGTFINGKEFDSSAKHGNQPAKFPVNRVVRGWTEALQMMKTGAKWELYLPSSLAYGDQGHGPGIEPGSTLIFEMELVGTETPAPPPPPAPLTSDIIRVPSQEELKKGAKIEVIKPEDLEKYTNAAAQKAEKKK
ncbi:MAG TPA: FKBP-type peptidyl-prolyl cis-trans isomerase [Candidatus Paceibacterota bacterium]|nr:FKBP-type peptidyl-prolyl cis-trans isomerase [Verrucomicrobiota bacterium]HSA10243.1 FKBP-type peptidyl-prolyl cis-trans isomerase [Candidatus Paceibacterota bacterium]